MQGSVGVVLMAIGLAALATEPAAAQPAPTFPSGVETVRLDAVVLDKEGRPVTGLAAADFQVEENGKARRISSFEAIVVRSTGASGPAAGAVGQPGETPAFVAPRVVAPEDGRTILVFFDELHVAAPNAEWARTQLATYLSRELREGDLVGVVSPGTHAWWFAATPSEREPLPVVLGRLQGRLLRRDQRPLVGVVGRGGPEAHLDIHQTPLTPWEAMRIDEGYDDKDVDPEKKMLARTIYAAERREIEMTLGSVGQALAALARLPGRKTLLFVSEGFLLMPKDKGEPYQRVIELARRANVVVEWIDPAGLTPGRLAAESDSALPGGMPDPNAARQGSVRDRETSGTRYLAVSTGGREFFTNDPTEGPRRALDESTAYYLIGYAPTEGPPGERKVRVQVKREGLTVRARSRYFRSAPEAPVRGAAALRQAADAFADATEVHFRMTVQPPSPAISTNSIAASRLTLAIDPAVGQPGERQIEVLVEARPLGTGEPVSDAVRLTVPPAARPLVVTRPLTLAAGVWQVRVALQDTATGAQGSARQTVEVP